MKSMSLYLLSLALLALVTACGKNNESGKTNFEYNNQFCAYPGAPGCNPMGNVSAYSTGIGVVDISQSENPCSGGSYFGGNRIRVQIQVQLPIFLGPQDLSIGVTSYGDVAYIQGNGSRTGMLTALLCPRMGQGIGQATQPVMGSGSSVCRSPQPNISLRPITAFDMYFPSGEVAKFRSPEAGRYDVTMNPARPLGPFSYCRPY